ncbi:Branch domain-containing protein [Cephalotus follicularis]|uniref:Branch domain-containing protein n=1 Tax=Cephalotus follicularis TaxID=3775 RepID=A0A1Q3CJ82_CEPFO|nr:Branch domain-containing protein [Cephalotus follicularis]
MPSKRLLALEEVKDTAAIAVGVKMNSSRPLSRKAILTFMLFLVLGFCFSTISVNTYRTFIKKSVIAEAPSTYQPSFEEASSIESWIRTQSGLRHAMNDTELFWRASFSPRIKHYPFKRVGKIAFMFLAKGPLPLAPLWQKFFDGHEGHYSIYIHSTPSYVSSFPPTSVFYNRQIPSQLVEWGQMSMCDAERRLLANALLDISNEWFVLVSESCIPLRNFTIVYRYISRSKYSFMGSFDEHGPNGRLRYNRSMEPEVTLPQWRKGAQWFEVNRRLAVLIVEDIKYYYKFKKFCKRDCYVDEHYFPTMLTIKVPHLLANRTLTRVDWSRRGPHPATFGKGDITQELFKKIFEREICLYNKQPSTVCFLFARKFAPSSLDPLLELSSKVLGF